MVTKTKTRIYSDFATRLHESCDKLGIDKEGRATRLSERLNRAVGYKGVSKWLDGDSMPDMAHGVLLATVLGQPFEWLMTGRTLGTKTQTQYAEGMLEGKARYIGLTDQALAFASQWQQLPPRIREAVQQVVIAANELRPKGKTA